MFVINILCLFGVSSKFSWTLHPIITRSDYYLRYFLFWLAKRQQKNEKCTLKMTTFWSSWKPEKRTTKSLNLHCWKIKKKQKKIYQFIYSCRLYLLERLNLTVMFSQKQFYYCWIQNKTPNSLIFKTRLIFAVLSGRFQNLFWKKERFWRFVVTATILSDIKTENYEGKPCRLAMPVER